MFKNLFLMFVAIIATSIHLSGQEILTTDPPFRATNFDLIPSIICEADATLFKSVSFTKKEKRKYADRRLQPNGFFTTSDINIYTATYTDDTSIEFELNIEFDQIAAMSLAKQYAEIFGRIPKHLRNPLETVTINAGDKVFSGLNNYFGADTRNVLVHVPQEVKYIDYSLYGMKNMLEETLIHEAVHSCLDDLFYIHDVDGRRKIRADWKAAMDKDIKYISTYAQSEQDREDMAESYLAWLALRYRPERLSEEQKKKIKETIPNRLTFLDNQNFDMSPLVKDTQYNVAVNTEGNYYRTKLSASPMVYDFDSNSYYRLTNKWQGEGKSLDIINDGTNNLPILNNTSSASGQLWKINKTGEDIYTLSSKWQGPTKILDCIQGSNQNRPVLNQETGYSGGAWKIISVGNGFYRITNMWLNDRSLDIINDGKNNKIQVAKTANVSGQMWKITKIE